MMKLLFIQPVTNLSGSAISLLNHISNLNGRYNITVLVPDNGIIVKEYKNIGCNVETMKMFLFSRHIKNLILYILFFLPSTFRIIHIIEKYNIDIVHINTYCNLYGGLATRIVNKPIVWHIRGFPSAPRIVVKIYMKLINMISTKIIFPSFTTLEELFIKNGISAKKTIIIYNGVNLKVFKPDLNSDYIRDEFNIGKEFRIVGVVSHVGETKGQHIFIQAAKIVLDRIPNTIFLIVGGCHINSYKMYLKKLAIKLNISNNIIFTGERKDIPFLLSAMNIVVLPSFSECFPRVVIEAMAVGKPVIATNVGGIPEAIINGKTGIITKPGNEEQLAKAILKLLNNYKLLKDMGSLSKKIVKSKFDIKVITKKIEKIYMDILENSN